MMKLVLALVTLVMAALPAGCIAPPGAVVPSGVTVTRDYPLSGFTRLSAGYAFELEVAPGPYMVSVTAPDNIIDRLEVSVEGDILQLKVRDIILGPPRLKAKIMLPRLDGIDLAGAVQAKLAGFKSADRFTLGLTGASRAELDLETGVAIFDISGASIASGALKAQAFKLVISGASQSHLKGSAATLNADISGASQMDLAEMTVGDTVLNLSGASQGIANISGRLDFELSGGSVMRYGGAPVMGKSSVSGGSRLEKR
jgi:hypothetical protein